MPYVIKTYQNGFLEGQFKIGSAKYDHWWMGGQTRIPQMQQIYSQAEFDPETRFYPFLGDEMVGFLNASDKMETERRAALFEFPYYKKGHKDAVDPLVKYAFAKLKEKEFDTLITRAGPYWGNTFANGNEIWFQKNPTDCECSNHGIRSCGSKTVQ